MLTPIQAKLVMTTSVPLTALFLDQSELNAAVTATQKAGKLPTTTSPSPKPPSKTAAVEYVSSPFPTFYDPYLP
jgi:hypothetical protein